MKKNLTFSLALFLCACNSELLVLPADDGGRGDAGNDVGSPPNPLPDGAVSDSSTGEEPGPGAVDPHKVDLLLVIDNSTSMSGKQDILAESVSALIDSLTGSVTPVVDMHIGVVTTSIGAPGGDLCTDGNANDHGELINRTRSGGVVANATQTKFLSWFPAVTANAGKPVPPYAITDATALKRDISDLVRGAGDEGCGYEAQLESWYRFLVQPDPYASVVRDGYAARQDGVDSTLLAQRAQFLRPDSRVAIVLVTDENDSAVDPLTINGQGWAFTTTDFPGSPNQHAPKPTSECASNPWSPSCTSCAFDDDDSNCSAVRYYNDVEDPLNLRMFQMKRRFGVDPQFPLARYVRALTQRRVPDRAHEHSASPGVPTNYVDGSNCQNPLFAASLPATQSDELCNLPNGPRRTSDVTFAVIGGVPWQLLVQDSNQPATSPFKSQLSEADFVNIVGQDPLAYNFTGADPHMLESVSPRAGLAAPTASDTADPIHGREKTAPADLQYACIFPLPVARDCTDPRFALSCQCFSHNNPSQWPDLPICSNTTPTLQTHDAAYPSIRELELARRVPGSIVGSLCPRSTDSQSADFGYRPTLRAIADRLTRP